MKQEKIIFILSFNTLFTPRANQRSSLEPRASIQPSGAQHFIFYFKIVLAAVNGSSHLNVKRKTYTFCKQKMSTAEVIDLSNEIVPSKREREDSQVQPKAVRSSVLST